MNISIDPICYERTKTRRSMAPTDRTEIDDFALVDADGLTPEGEELLVRLKNSDTLVQSKDTETISDETDRPAELDDLLNIIEQALLSDDPWARNGGMRAVLDLVNLAPEAGAELIEPALEALREPGASSAKNELIKALWGVYRNTDNSIGKGDAIYADLISGNDRLVVERAVEYIGGAVMDAPEEFPKTLDAIVEVLDTPDESIASNAVIVIGVVARDAPHCLPDPEHLTTKLKEVRKYTFLEDERETINKALRFVEKAATTDIEG
jgi:hypothetical protein